MYEYTIFRIKKNKNNFRTLYSPNEEYKNLLRQLLPELELILTQADSHKVCYAFVKGENCVTNALQHMGYNFTLSLDLKNFFDSISLGMLKNVLYSSKINASNSFVEYLEKYCFIDGAPKQGLPTSPLISNISFSTYDNLIIESLKKYKISSVYTRYADDLIFSFDNQKDIGKIMWMVKQIVESAGFYINQKKTKVQNIKNGRIIITGIGIDKKGIYPTRKMKKKLRAMLHNENKNGAIGLIEWMKCKAPILNKIKIPTKKYYYTNKKNKPYMLITYKEDKRKIQWYTSKGNLIYKPLAYLKAMN